MYENLGGSELTKNCQETGQQNDMADLHYIINYF